MSFCSLSKYLSDNQLFPSIATIFLWVRLEPWALDRLLEGPEGRMRMSTFKSIKVFTHFWLRLSLSGEREFSNGDILDAEIQAKRIYAEKLFYEWLCPPTILPEEKKRWD
jgi:hypothetical protein